MGTNERNGVEKKHHLISDTLRERIVSGLYTEQIPGQRVLADEFGVNFLTVRKAVATLAKEGLVDRRAGRGTFITRLRRAKTFNLAAVLGGLSYGFGGQHLKLVEGIQAEASKSNYDVIFRPHLGDPQLERRAIEGLIEAGKCDGFLLWPTRHEGSSAVELLQERGIPFVIVMRVDARHRERVSYVVDDDFEGGYLATRHLLALGHRRIGFVGRSAVDGGVDTFEEERWLGFTKAHAESGLAPGPRIQADWLAKPESKIGGLSRKFQRSVSGLTGLVCVNDRVALHLLGPLAVGAEGRPAMAVVGYDDIEAAELFGLTTVHQPLAEIGAEAVRLLFAEMDQPARLPAQRKLAPRLVVRESSRTVEKS